MKLLFLIEQPGPMKYHGVDRPTRLSFFEGGFSAAPCINDFDTLVYNKTINKFKEWLAIKNI